MCNLSSKTIAILGCAFKSKTNDSRESASILVAEKLYNAGAILEVFDPMVNAKTIENDINFHWRSNFEKVSERLIINTNLTFNGNIDAYVVLTEWNDFINIDISKHKVFDGRGIINGSYFSIGKS